MTSAAKQEVTEQGFAGYVELVAGSSDAAINSALLVVNGRGDPLAFCFNRGTFSRPPFWRGRSGRRHLLRLLVCSLLDCCPIRPDVILMRSDDGELLSEDLGSQIPLGVAKDGFVRWLSEQPPDGSAGASVVSDLIAREMLAEPFERTYAGLRQANAGL
jgi:hypothetical protein